MQQKLTLAALFALAVHTDPSLMSEKLSMDFRTEHKDVNGEVHYLFADGSIYSVEDGAFFVSLDSMKDVLLETYGERQEGCKTLDDLLRIKCA